VQDWNRLQMILNTAGISFGSWFICGVAMKSIQNSAVSASGTIQRSGIMAAIVQCCMMRKGIW
jgi:hypothetical protein